MYKAIVEQISGLMVRAGGKWLRCIGNKDVKVGDRIWTDGRCVYGFNREGQAPIVINSPKEIFGIPILMENGYSNAKYISKEFTFSKNSFLKANEIYHSTSRPITRCRFIENGVNTRDFSREMKRRN